LFWGGLLVVLVVLVVLVLPPVGVVVVVVVGVEVGVVVLGGWGIGGISIISISSSNSRRCIRTRGARVAVVRMLLLVGLLLLLGGEGRWMQTEGGQRRGGDGFGGRERRGGRGLWEMAGEAGGGRQGAVRRADRTGVFGGEL
jgi:hypothetical protein